MQYTNFPYIFGTTANEALDIYIGTLEGNTITSDGMKLYAEYVLNAKADTVFGVRLGELVLLNVEPAAEFTHHISFTLQRINQTKAVIMGEIVRGDGQVTPLAAIIDSDIDFMETVTMVLYGQSVAAEPANDDVLAMGGYFTVLDS